MSEAAVAPVPVRGAAARRLARDTALVASRLADVVAGLPDADGTTADVERFLRSSAREAPPPEPFAPQPLDRVARAFGLAPVEVDLIVLAGLAEEHEGYAAALRRVSATGVPYASAGLAVRLLCIASDERTRLRALLETGAAVASGALVVDRGAPFFDRPLRVGDALWSALHELDVWPAGVRRLEPSLPPAGLEEWVATPPARRAAAALAQSAPVTILVTAESDDAAVGRAHALVAAAGLDAVALELEEPSPELAALVGVHALARNRVPLVRVVQPEPPARPVPLDLARHPAPVVVCARAGAVPVRGRRPVLAVPADPLTPRARRRMWSALLPELEAEAASLAARHPVDPVVAAEAVADVRVLQAVDGARRPHARDIAESIRVRAGVSFSAGVTLVRPAARWDHLVVRADRLAQLREALERLRHQSVVLDDWGFLDGRAGARGVRMLFAGPPGTGKTLAAEVLAHDIGCDLLVVDIARVVSKWIGETEKNLAEVFDAAERAQAVLFFDEADALFGRRTEVSDAHDRYANLETAYLLTRLERFEGLAVLATNLRQNIDAAFTRRLEFAVDFDEPGVTEREELWRCHLPPTAPVDDDVDVAQLARLYPVVGGVIRNAATAAAFVAAAEGVAIARRHLAGAVRREYEKAGRAFPGAPTERPTAGRTDG